MSAGPDSSTDPMIVYVRLLDEGTEVFRPTKGEVLGHGRVRLLATDDYDATDEHWEFLPGAIVFCEDRTLDGDRVKVACAISDVGSQSKT